MGKLMAQVAPGVWEEVFPSAVAPPAATDEVWVGPAAPTDAATELWVDEDDAGSASIEEVFVGNDDPDVSVPGNVFDLWIDADAVSTIPPGPAGPPGPSAVSADAGNQAVLGSDSLLYVPTARAFGFLTRWVGTATSGVLIPFSSTIYENGGWVMADSIAVPVGADGIYQWSAYISCTAAPVGSPSYMSVSVAGYLYSDGFVPNAGAMTMSGVSHLVAGQTINALINIGAVQDVTIDLSFVRVGSL